MASNGELLPNPLRTKKAQRGRHPSEPEQSPTPGPDSPTQPTHQSRTTGGHAPTPDSSVQAPAGEPFGPGDPRRDTGVIPAGSSNAPDLAALGATPPRAQTNSTNRVGPNRVRKSLYMAADVADQLSTLTDAIHYDSRGAVSKADAAGELIRRGLLHADDVYRALGVHRST